MPGLGILDREALALRASAKRDRLAGRAPASRDRFRSRPSRRRSPASAAIARGSALRAQPRERLAHEALARVGVERRIDAQRLAAGQRAERFGLRFFVRREEVFEHERVAGRHASAAAHTSRRGCARSCWQLRTTITRRSARNGIAVDASATARPTSSVSGPVDHVEVERAHVGRQRAVERSRRARAARAATSVPSMTIEPVELRRLVEEVVVFHAATARRNALGAAARRRRAARASESSSCTADAITPYSVMMPAMSAAGRHVEGRIVDGVVGGDADFVGGALLDRDPGAVGEREVERRARRGDVERDAVVRGGDRHAVGADLVRRVAVARDAVGADDDGGDRLALHRDRGRRIDDERARHAGFAQLEHRQPRALQAAAASRRRRRAALCRRGARRRNSPSAVPSPPVASGPGVAVREHVAALREKLDRGLADAPSISRCSAWIACASAQIVAVGRAPARDRPPRPG